MTGYSTMPAPRLTLRKQDLVDHVHAAVVGTQIGRDQVRAADELAVAVVHAGHEA